MCRGFKFLLGTQKKERDLKCIYYGKNDEGMIFSIYMEGQIDW